MNKRPIVARPFHYTWHIPFLVRTIGDYTMYVDGEVIEKMIVTILEGFERIERKLDRMNRLKDCFDGDELLDNVDLCKLLNVTDRTLARYRSKKLIKYYIIDRRIYYRSSEVREFMKAQGMKR